MEGGVWEVPMIHGKTSKLTKENRRTLRALSVSIEKLRIIQHNFKHVSLRRILAEPRVWCPDRSLNNVAVCQGVGESTSRKGR